MTPGWWPGESTANRANRASMRKQFTSNEDGRLDKVISDQTKLSRKRARKVIEAGGVRVNGKKAKFASQYVPAGLTVAFQSSTPTNSEFTFDVCYKDEAVVVTDLVVLVEEEVVVPQMVMVEVVMVDQV